MDTEHTQDLAEEGLQQFRIERGAQVLGTDGLLGTVHQVVMDQQSGKLQSLVVRGEAGMEYELPADHIETATGDAVWLNIGRADLADHPNLARPYEPEMYRPVESGQVMPPGSAADQAQDNPMLTNIEDNAVDVVAPASDAPADLGAMGRLDNLDDDLDDDLDDLDVVEEVEAVIIPGDRPGEADVYLASASDVPTPGTMTPAAAGGWMPTRGPQGADYQGPGGRSIVGALAATGVLLFTGGAITIYLLARRKQERASLGARVRQQTSAATGNAAALRDTLRARGMARWADLSARTRDQQRQVRDQMNEWGPVVASSLMALRDRAVERGNALGDTLQQQARQATKATTRAVSPGGPARRTANRLSDRLSDRASDLRDQFTALATALASQAQQRGRSAATWQRMQRMQRHAQANGAWRQLRTLPGQASDAWGRLTRQATQAAQTAATTNAPAMRSVQKTTRRATATAAKQAKQARANAQRGVRRVRRRIRWFRNGIVAGVIGGVLYAPRAGRDTRTNLAGWLQRIPGLDALLSPATASTTPARSTSGAAGPHPRATLPDARDSWRGMGTGSEQPGGLPLAPDLTPEDMPDPTL